MRGDLRVHRFVHWVGEWPKPGEGVQYFKGRARYVITQVVRTARMTKTVFRLHLRVLGPGDPDPSNVYVCYRVMKAPVSR